MKLIKYFISVIFVFCLLLILSVFIDCKRLHNALSFRLEEVDLERKKFEERYIQDLSAFSIVNSNALNEIIAKYHASNSNKERDDHFLTLTNLVTKEFSVIPYNETTRRNIDELNGLLNRRERIGPEYEKAIQAQNELGGGICKYCGF